MFGLSFSPVAYILKRKIQGIDKKADNPFHVLHNVLALFRITGSKG